jgi:hypothetical protein
MTPLSNPVISSFAPLDAVDAGAAPPAAAPPAATPPASSTATDGVGRTWFPWRPPTPEPQPDPYGSGSFFGVMDKLMDQLQAMFGQLGGGGNCPDLPGNVRQTEPVAEAGPSTIATS